MVIGATEEVTATQAEEVGPGDSMTMVEMEAAMAEMERSVVVVVSVVALVQGRTSPFTYSLPGPWTLARALKGGDTRGAKKMHFYEGI